MKNINLLASHEDKLKAEITRSIFDFNHDALIKARENAAFRFVFDAAVSMETYEIRFIFG